MYILVSKYSMFCFGIELDIQKSNILYRQINGLPTNRRPTDKDSYSPTLKLPLWTYYDVNKRKIFIPVWSCRTTCCLSVPEPQPRAASRVRRLSGGLGSWGLVGPGTEPQYCAGWTPGWPCWLGLKQEHWLWFVVWIWIIYCGTIKCEFGPVSGIPMGVSW